MKMPERNEITKAWAGRRKAAAPAAALCPQRPSINPGPPRPGLGGRTGAGP